MIKVSKNLSNPPISLKIPNKANFPGKSPRNAKTTHKRRVEIISKGAYIDENKYNSRYKMNDIRSDLISIYNGKCAFCEQKIEQYHIEHFRPKKTYYWLAYSWDNLLMACPTCNEHKGVQFDLLGTKARFVNSPANLNCINSISSSYDAIELPKMVNPENTDPKGKINFTRMGEIESHDVNFNYTIKSCKIDRPPLNDQRRDILNVFKRDIESVLTDFDSKEDHSREINSIVRKFVRDSRYPKFEYIAFRQFAIENMWLNDIVKEVVV